MKRCLKTESSVFEAYMSSFKLKPDVKFHLYISQSPCGDASMSQVESSQTDEERTVNLEKKRKYEEDIRDEMKKSKKMKEGDNGRLQNLEDAKRRGNILRGRDSFNVQGALRTKPGRLDSEVSLAMSCSDKIAKWNVVGICGAMVSILLEPIYLSSIVVGDYFDSDAIGQACIERLSSTTDLPSGYRVSKPSIKPASSDFDWSKGSLLKSRDSKSIVTCHESITWSLGCEPDREVIVNGRRQGFRPKDGKWPLKAIPKITKRVLSRTSRKW
ncbi:adenosine deaminase/editase [Chytridium lagenaria]|nr:adenosine deaminase/editase [Chytridium lagenaria]